MAFGSSKSSSDAGGNTSASGKGTSSSSASSTASAGPIGGQSHANTGGNAGNSNGSSNSSAGRSSGTTNSAAGDSSAGSDSKQGGLAAGTGQNAGSSSSSTSNSNASSAATGGRMAGLQSAVSAARDAKNSNISGTQRGIANAVANAFGAAQSADTGAAGTTSPNATPGQKAAYNTGYRNETNAGMTRSAFGALPGVGSLVGEGIARSAMSQPGNLADNEKSAYANGTVGAKDAGLGNTARAAGSLLGGVLGGPIGSALASMALGGYSYAQQRAANPAAFEGVSQYSGPVTGQIQGVSGNGNSGEVNPAATGSMVSALDQGFGLPSDYSDRYRSYQSMNLGEI